MKKVHSKNNLSTELRLIEIFQNNNIKGWRRHYPVKGHPDFVFLEKRIAIFVDGCFWHGHDCRNTRPKENEKFWRDKQERNAIHDKEITSIFQNRKWRVLRIWECELSKKKLQSTVDKIQSVLKMSGTLP